MPRLFFALEIPQPIRQHLLQVKAQVAGARWQTDAQLHLTLLFLGNVPADAVPEIRAALKSLSQTRFALDVRGLGCFGQPATPRNLWAGVAPEAPLQALQAELKQRLDPLGFDFEKRPFRPHITLARFKQRRGSVQELLGEHEQTEFGSVPVDDFVLLQSTQANVEGRQGSVYTVVERFALANPPDEFA